MRPYESHPLIYHVPHGFSWRWSSHISQAAPPLSLFLVARCWRLVVRPDPATGILHVPLVLHVPRSTRSARTARSWSTSQPGGVVPKEIELVVLLRVGDIKGRSSSSRSSGRPRLTPTLATTDNVLHMLLLPRPSPASCIFWDVTASLSHAAANDGARCYSSLRWHGYQRCMEVLTWFNDAAAKEAWRCY
jgi:hypothetical protein